MDQPTGITLVLGGARSGKSRFAEGLLGAAPRPIYLATAEALDDEMRDRIASHQARRDDRWTTVDAPFDLEAALRGHCARDAAVMVDCLTVWMGNLMHAGRDVEAEAGKLAVCLPELSGTVVLVANEVGLGIVPDNPMARVFRDHAGLLNQAVAAVADRVYFLAAGLPMTLKDVT